MIEHGGNTCKLAEELGVPEDKIIDFSASINPLGISKKVESEMRKELKKLHNYPDPDTKKLRKKLSQYHGIDPETILCSNGSTELIYLIPRTLKPETVLIPFPTFSEYERAVNSSKSLKIVQNSSSLNNIKPLNNVKQKQPSTIVNLPLKKADNFRINSGEFIDAMQGCDMAFLCNPNNPTGNLLKKNQVLKIAEAAKKSKCFLIVDEAFIDFRPEESVIKAVQDNPYLIVLRSMTKFHALTGLRIGYGVFSPAIANKLKKFKEPWTVNTLAQKAAIAALGDNEYADRTFRLIAKEKRFLEGSLKETGIEFYPSDVNFYLLKTRGNAGIASKLREKGILVRDCSNFRGLDSSFIRVAVRSRRETKVLIKTLIEECFQIENR